MLKNKLLVGILVLATALRFIGLMPNISHPDEGHVQTISYNLVKNIIDRGDFNPHSFKYGSWEFYLQALGVFPVFATTYIRETANTLISSGFTSPLQNFDYSFDKAVSKYAQTLLLFGRAQTALFGVLSVYLLYLLAKDFLDQKVGLIAALILAVSPLHVRDSHYITTDVFFVFFILLSFVFMVRLSQKRRWRDFILAGFFAGTSATIRFFPLAFLVYPIAALIGFERKKTWWLKVFTGVFFACLGIFVGLPFLFLDPHGPALFMQDLAKYALPWYQTAITSFVLSGGQTGIQPILVAFGNFRPVYVAWLVFNHFGILPSLAGALGFFILLFKSFRKWLLLVTIPIFNFIYMAFFIPAIYERLNLPSLPFLAILAALAVSRVKSRVVKVAGLFLLILVPLFNSASASIACGQKSTQELSKEWVGKNIDLKAKIAHLPMVSSPTNEFAAWVELKPGQKFSLADVLKEGLGYAFINGGRLDYNTYLYFNDFFTPPKGLYENSYLSLSLSEYQSRARLLQTIRKPSLCDTQRIYYFELPPKQTEVHGREVKITGWQVKNVDPTGTADFSSENEILKYTQTPFGFTPARLASGPVNVKEGEVYTFSFLARASENSEGKLPAVIARTDFYTPPGNIITDNLKRFYLFLREGQAPVFYEKKREVLSGFSDPDLPGRAVSLSGPAHLSSAWQKVSVTTQVPQGVNLGVFSIQPISPDGATIYLSQIGLFSGSE